MDRSGAVRPRSLVSVDRSGDPAYPYTHRTNRSTASTDEYGGRGSRSRAFPDLSVPSPHRSAGPLYGSEERPYRSIGPGPPDGEGPYRSNGLLDADRVARDRYGMPSPPSAQALNRYIAAMYRYMAALFRDRKPQDRDSRDARDSRDNRDGKEDVDPGLFLSLTSLLSLVSLESLS